MRNDIHRPSAINPYDYEFVAFEYIKIGKEGDIMGDCAFLQGERETIRRHMQNTGGTYSRHEHGGNCHICGAGAIYTVLFYHRLSNSYIRTGQDCAQKMEMAVGGDFDMFHTAVRSALELHAGKRKAQAILDELGFAQAWTVYAADYSQFTSLPYEEQTLLDIVGKLVRFGAFYSEKQAKFVGRLLDQINRRAEIQAARTAQYQAAANLPVPSGRSTVEGTVLSMKHEVGYYGPVTKMLVSHASGWKVWGTCPSKIVIAKGDQIRFNAAVTPSQNDPKFGFFSRPTQTQVLTSVAVELAA